MPRTRITADTHEHDAALELARRVGERIRAARRRAGLTQSQLAGERYTKAYISALETGITRPSMVALNYIADQLGLPASHFLGEAHPAWGRLEVDMRLAAGDWSGAAEGYQAVLEGGLSDVARAEALRGLAEAESRQDTVGRRSPPPPKRYGCLRQVAASRTRRWLATGSPTGPISPTTRPMPAISCRPCSPRCAPG